MMSFCRMGSKVGNRRTSIWLTTLGSLQLLRESEPRATEHEDPNDKEQATGHSHLIAINTANTSSNESTEHAAHLIVQAILSNRKWLKKGRLGFLATATSFVFRWVAIVSAKGCTAVLADARNRMMPGKRGRE
jgi:hypothetical protein